LNFAAGQKRKNNMEYLKVKDLIGILQDFNDELPVIITHNGKDHQYGVTDDGIFLTKSAYFGNDPEADEAYGDCKLYLNIGNI